MRPEELTRAASAYRLSQAIFAVAALGVADHLAERARGAEDLALLTGTDADALRRVMRAVSSEGVFDEGANGTFALNEVSTQLLRGGEAADMIVGWSAMPAKYRAYSRMLEALQTGRIAFEIEHGVGFHEYLARAAAARRAYDEANAATVEPFDHAVAAYDFSDVRHAIDVGGGRGSLAVSLLRSHPHMRATVVDLPDVIALAEKADLREDIASRLTFVAADCFVDRIPTGDAYVLSTVLRLFNDDAAVRLLRRIRESAPVDARVLVLDFLQPEGPLSSPFGLADLDTMVVYGGRDRSAAEFAAVFERAGLRLHATAAADHPFFWIEARIR